MNMTTHRASSTSSTSNAGKKETVLTAFGVANYILSKVVGVNGRNLNVTPLKLQKLLYYTQGFHLALNGKPLFQEDFHYHTTGFIIPRVMKRYSEYGYFCIPLTTYDNDNGYIVYESKRIIDTVLDTYGELDGKFLEELVTQDTIWYPDRGGQLISKEALLMEFKEKIAEEEDREQRERSERRSKRGRK
jgi:uncharacterized phage-associated protein